jgi:hypothetical protein
MKGGVMNYSIKITKKRTETANAISVLLKTAKI